MSNSQNASIGGGGLNSEEVDDLSMKVEQLAQNEDVSDRQTVLYVLRALPDSEWGQGQYDEGRLE